MVSTWVTRCPQCGTSFRLTKSQLNAANGSVRCGSCMHVFLATNYLIPDNQTTLAGYSEKSSTPNTRFDQGLQRAFDVEDDLLELEEPSTEETEQTSPPDTPTSPTLEEDSFHNVDESWALALLAELEQEEELEEARVKKSQEKNNARPSHSPKKAVQPAYATSNDSSQAATIKTSAQFQSTFQPTTQENQDEKTSSKQALPFSTQQTADTKPETVKPLPAIQANEAQKQVDAQPSNTQISSISAVTTSTTISEVPATGNTAKPEPSSADVFNMPDTRQQEQTDSNTSATQPEDQTASAPTFNWIKSSSKETPTQPATSLPSAEPKEKAGSSVKSSLSKPKQNKPVKRPKTLLPEEEDEPVIEDIEQPAATETDAENSFLLNELASDPLELVLPEKRNWWKISAWTLANLVLVAGLIVQYGWFKFDALAQDERYRPYYAKACHYVGCKLPTRIDINKIKGNELLVRSHPRYPNALLIDAIIFNQANFAQPFPTIKLTFSDINDNVIASRGFKPVDYLAGELAGSKEMPARVPIHLSFEIVDPGPSAVNYHMTFLQRK
ncbi:DUF3426 domain-containing protein [Zooshikella harenae]|uniref:Zinc-ribbon domain-containing protein n=1 Tax=Zooshikella harenae TaxID=2827238 RepID=A0ABS5ZA42_9GAMM|nr:DUF3426 domain-containing protein [Zooshikella harenae]MBU2710921.1 zinc-ribbon domain-containing protein [Zooshikella harenae]